MVEHLHQDRFPGMCHAPAWLFDRDTYSHLQTIGPIIQGLRSSEDGIFLEIIDGQASPRTLIATISLTNEDYPAANDLQTRYGPIEMNYSDNGNGSNIRISYAEIAREKGTKNRWEFETRDKGSTILLRITSACVSLDAESKVSSERRDCTFHFDSFAVNGSALRELRGACKVSASPAAGLLDKEIISFYAAGMTATFSLWPSLTPHQRLRALSEQLNKTFTAIGIPPCLLRTLDRYDERCRGAVAAFGAPWWLMIVTPEFIYQNDLTASAKRDLAKFLFHESRHAEQTFLASRKIAAEYRAKGDALDSFRKHTGLHKRIAAKAREFPLQETDPRTAFAAQMAHAMCSPETEERRQFVYEFPRELSNFFPMDGTEVINLVRWARLYFNSPHERDAYRAEKLVSHEMGGSFTSKALSALRRFTGFPSHVKS